MNRRKANGRIQKELALLSRGSAAPGIAAWAREDGSRLDVLDAEICGAPDTPYEGGTFRLEINIPPEYPLKPPRVTFSTKIYHPNIDSHGRICLDSLNMPPQGAWKPSLNISTLLTSIQALMSEPNADDGLMADITDEFRQNPALFHQKAKQHTQRFAFDSPKESAENIKDARDTTENAQRESERPKENDIHPRPSPDGDKSDEEEEGGRISRLRKKPRHSQSSTK